MGICSKGKIGNSRSIIFLSSANLPTYLCLFYQRLVEPAIIDLPNRNTAQSIFKTTGCYFFSIILKIIITFRLEKQKGKRLLSKV